MARFAHWETGEGFTKKERVRLARAELLMLLAGKAGQWADWLLGRDGDGSWTMDDWPEDDTFRTLCRTYGLTKEDLARLLYEQELNDEDRASRAGFDEHWDPAPVPKKPRARKGR